MEPLEQAGIVVGAIFVVNTIMNWVLKAIDKLRKSDRDPVIQKYASNGTVVELFKNYMEQTNKIAERQVEMMSKLNEALIKMDNDMQMVRMSTAQTLSDVKTTCEVVTETDSNRRPLVWRDPEKDRALQTAVLKILKET